MPAFRYKGVATGGGAPVEGEIDAADRDAVVASLQAMGLIPIRIDPARGGGRSESSASGQRRKVLFERKRVSAEQVASFTRELSTLLLAGLPLDRALEILLGMADSEAYRTLIRTIRDDVRGGAALSVAMDRHRNVFARFYLSMVRAGEAGGALGAVLGRIGEFMDRAKELRDTVVSALIYPLILVAVSLISVMLLLIFVVPQFTVMFKEAGRSLPLATEIVVACGEFLRAYWWALIVGAILARYVAVRVLARPLWRYRWDRKLLQLPLAGSLIVKVEVTRFARTLATLLGSGVPLLAALGIVKDTVANTYLVDKLEKTRESLRHGEGLAKPLGSHGVFPPLAIHMIQVGEETGALGTMLFKVADAFDREVQTAVKRLLALIEPVMILGLGLVIGGIIMSILVAIFEVNSLVK